MIAFRITKSTHLAQAMSGQGAKEFGGRWNSKGSPVIYTAATQSLAALEILAHLADYSFLKQEYSLLELELPAELVKRLPVTDLPPDWRAAEHGTLKRIGDAWLDAAESAVLQVPSAISPRESNLLVNPLHPDFARIAVGEPEPFAFDPRLGK